MFFIRTVHRQVPYRCDDSQLSENLTINLNTDKMNIKKNNDRFAECVSVVTVILFYFPGKDAVCRRTKTINRKPNMTRHSRHRRPRLCLICRTAKTTARGFSRKCP